MSIFRLLKHLNHDTYLHYLTQYHLHSYCYKQQSAVLMKYPKRRSVVYNNNPSRHQHWLNIAWNSIKWRGNIAISIASISLVQHFLDIAWSILQQRYWRNIVINIASILHLLNAILMQYRWQYRSNIAVAILTNVEKMLHVRYWCNIYGNIALSPLLLNINSDSLLHLLNINIGSSLKYS